MHLPVNIADFVVSPGDMDWRDHDATGTHPQTARGMYRQAAMIENEFVRFELECRIRADVRSRARKFDSGRCPFLGLNPVTGE